MFFLFYAFREVYQSILMHRFRVLSIGFGILWAFWILIFLLATVRGLATGVQKAFERYGRKTMFVASHAQAIPMGVVHQLNQKIDGVEQMSPVVSYRAMVRYQANVDLIDLLAVDACYASMANLSCEGRFFSPLDIKKSAPVCVLGAKFKKKWFGESSALGQYICVGNLGLLVVGVLNDLGNEVYKEQDCILVTYAFLLAQEKSLASIHSMRVALTPTADDKKVEEQLQSYLERHAAIDHHSNHAFSIFNLGVHAHKFCRFFRNLEKGSWMIGFCFLLTGVVGVGSMMWMIMADRVQEISIRRILGAKAREIVAMILWEVLITIMVAGILGCLIGFGVIELLNLWLFPLLKQYYVDHFTISWGVLFMGLGWMVISSCLAAIFPMIRALRMKPVEGLFTV